MYVYAYNKNIIYIYIYIHTHTHTQAVLGGTLEQLISTVRGRGLPVERAAQIARSVAAAMRDVHAK